MCERSEYFFHAPAAQAIGVAIADTEGIEHGGDARRCNLGIMSEQGRHGRPAHFGPRHEVTLQIVGMNLDQTGDEQVAVEILAQI